MTLADRLREMVVRTESNRRRQPFQGRIRRQHPAILGCLSSSRRTIFGANPATVLRALAANIVTASVGDPRAACCRRGADGGAAERVSSAWEIAETIDLWVADRKSVG